MQLAQLRHDVVAPAVGLTDDALRVLQQRMYRVPQLAKAGMKGRAGAKGDSGLLATASSSALLILAGMLAKDRFTIGERVLRLWRAHYQFAGSCPATHARTLGAALIAILEDPDKRAKLQWFDIETDNSVGMLFWADQQQPSVFHPYDAREWARRVQHVRAAAGTMMTLKRLPVASFDKIAKRLEAAALANEGTA